jgi:hypothetical protein
MVTVAVQRLWMKIEMRILTVAENAGEERWTLSTDARPMTGIVRHRIFTGDALPFPRSMRGMIPARRGEWAWC